MNGKVRTYSYIMSNYYVFNWGLVFSKWGNIPHTLFHNSPPPLPIHPHNIIGTFFAILYINRVFQEFLDCVPLFSCVLLPVMR